MRRHLLACAALSLAAGVAHADGKPAQRQSLDCLTFALPSAWQIGPKRPKEEAGNMSLVYEPPGPLPAQHESIAIREVAMVPGSSLAGTAAEARKALPAGAVVDTKLDGQPAFQTIVVRPIDQAKPEVKLRELSLHTLFNGKWYVVKGFYPLAREAVAKDAVEGFFGTLKLDGCKK